MIVFDWETAWEVLMLLRVDFSQWNLIIAKSTMVNVGWQLSFNPFPCLNKIVLYRPAWQLIEENGSIIRNRLSNVAVESFLLVAQRRREERKKQKRVNAVMQSPTINTPTQFETM